MKKLLIFFLIVFAFLSCVNMEMVWNPNAIYHPFDSVLVWDAAGNGGQGWYTSYVCIQDNNIGHYPPDTLKIWWDK